VEDVQPTEGPVETPEAIVIPTVRTTPAAETDAETPEVPAEPLILVEIEEPEIPLAAEAPAVLPETVPAVPEAIVLAAELIEEPVPLGVFVDATPYTGDNSGVWVLLTILSGLSLAAMGNALLRKRD
jgi:hypothetical protein